MLILGDERARKVASRLRSLLPTCQVTSFIKPCANFGNVVHKIENQVCSFGKDDFICIIAGGNDYEGHNTISFRLLKKVIASCSHTNLVIASVPYTTNPFTNKQIYDYNNNLFELINKLNRYSKHILSYYEINNESFHLSKRRISEEIADLVLETNSPNVLIFPDIAEETPSSEETAKETNFQLTASFPTPRT